MLNALGEQHLGTRLDEEVCGLCVPGHPRHLTNGVAGVKLLERLPNAAILEDEVLSPLRGHELSEVELYISIKLLREASAERPVSNQELRSGISLAFKEHENMSSRIVKHIIRALRKEHSFPIVASRCPPYGYWWCASAEEMKAFIEHFKSQPMDELHTLGRMVREHFPELSGQLRFGE